MLVVGREPQPPSTASSVQHQYLPAPGPVREVPESHPHPQHHLDLGLEGRSIPLQQRAPQPLAAPPSARGPREDAFSPSCLQLRIDLHGEHHDHEEHVPKITPLSRKQRAQQRRRLEQQKPAEEVVVHQRRRAPSAPRVPLAMSTMSMPASGQKFVTDDAVFGSAEEASVAVKRLLAKTSLVEGHHVTSNKTSESATYISDGYLQDSFDFLHQRHMKSLSDVISRHQQRPAGAPLGQPAASGLGPEQAQSAQLASKFKKQVHIHQSSFYDDQTSQLGEMSGDVQTFKSTKSINLSNSNNNSSSSCDQEQQQRRCVRENSSSSVRSASSDNFNNNNYCDAVSVNNKSNTKVSSKSSTSSSTSSTSSSTTRVQQSFSTKKQVFKSFSSSSQDFEDRMGIDVMMTPSPGTVALVNPMDVANMANSMAAISTGSKKVKETKKVTSSSSSSVCSSDRPDQVECKQSVKSFKSKTVKKSVSDGKQVHTDVDKYSETAEEEAEGAPDKPVITFSHVSNEGSHQTFTDNIVRFDSSTLSSPSRSRSPSPLLEMPAPYNDLSKEIKRPPVKA